jgi:hypothetical protein
VEKWGKGLYRTTNPLNNSSMTTTSVWILIKEWNINIINIKRYNLYNESLQRESREVENSSRTLVVTIGQNCIKTDALD